MDDSTAPASALISYSLSPAADEDVFEIWRDLAKQAGYAIANRVEGELYEAFGALAEVPGQGHRREDLTRKDLLFFNVYSYMIVFRIADPIEIVRVLHGRRNLKRLLKP